MLNPMQAAKLARFPELADLYVPKPKRKRVAKPRKIRAKDTYRKARPLYVVETDTLYPSAQVAADALGINRASIYEAMSKGSTRFRYATPEESQSAGESASLPQEGAGR